jgi:hypothetical protein
MLALTSFAVLMLALSSFAASADGSLALATPAFHSRREGSASDERQSSAGGAVARP